MKHCGISKPIGLKKICDVVENICKEANAYRHGAKLRNMIIPLDSGSGRTTYIEYLTEMFKKHGVLEFVCSTDDYIEVTVDASSPKQIAKTFSQIKETADYGNDYSNVVGMDISDVANYIGQAQYKDFLTNIKDLSKTAFIVLFVHSETSKNEETLIKGIIETVGEERFIRLPAETYTHEEICSLVKKIIIECGISIKNEKQFSRDLSNLMSALGVIKVNDAISITDTLIHFADYSGNEPFIDCSCISNLESSGYYKSERNNNK